MGTTKEPLDYFPSESDESSPLTFSSLDDELSGSSPPTSELERELNIENFVKVVTREEWGAAPPKNDFFPVKLPVRNVWFIFDTDSDPCKTNEECRRSMRDLQRRMQNVHHLTDIPFNFLVGGDGKVYEGRGWHNSAPDVKSFPRCNRRRIEIGYLGRFNRRDLSLEIVTKAYDLVSFGLRDEYLIKNFDIKEWAIVGEPYEPDTEPEFVPIGRRRRAPPKSRYQSDSESSSADDPTPTTYDYVKNFDKWT